jgi:hypothetical protein
VAEKQLTGAGKGCILVVFLGAVLVMVGGALLAVPGLYWAGRPERQLDPVPAPEPDALGQPAPGKAPGKAPAGAAARGHGHRRARLDRHAPHVLPQRQR